MSSYDLLTRENFGDYADIQKRPLTKEEIASTPYAKFYDFPIPKPTEEQIEALAPGHEIPVELSMTPADYGKMFDPEAHLVENGFCIRPEGFGFSAVNVKFPGVTWDMFQWFVKWYTSNPVHYMSWLPHFHVESSMVIARENLGWGDRWFDKSAGPAFTPEMFGIQDPKASDPDFISLLGGANQILDIDDLDRKHPVKMTMVNYFRRCGDGIENRIRVWMGVHYIDGQFVHEDETSQVPLYQRTRMMACHNAWEWTRAASLIPEIYKFAKEIGEI